MSLGRSRFSGSCCPHVISSVRLRNSRRLSGPLNWNRQQGLYIYRADRLVQWGGWNGIRGIDEHTKLARAALDFDTDLDSVFNINVAKMRVTHPAADTPDAGTPDQRAVRPRGRPVPEDVTARGRRSESGTARRLSPEAQGRSESPQLRSRSDAGLALRAAAMQAGEYEAFRRIVAVLTEQAPEIAARSACDT